MLKRHLMTDHGLTPEQYRAKWGLGPDYPMVAPNYSVQRQALAKQFGLGRGRPRLRRPSRRSRTAAARRLPEPPGSVRSEPAELHRDPSGSAISVMVKATGIAVAPC